MASHPHSIQSKLDDARIVARRAEAHRLMRRYQEALIDFTRAIDLASTYAWVIAHRGETYCMMEHFQEALSDFNQAIEIDPTYAWAFAHRGVVYRLIQNYERALSDFGQAIELDSTYAWAFAYRARTYELLYCYEETLADFDRAIALDEKLFDDWPMIRGMMLSYLGRFEEAIACCQQVLAKDPSDLRALYNLAVFKARWQGLTEANTELCQTRLTLLSRLSKAETKPQGILLYRIGGLAALEGKPTQALDYLEQAIALNAEEVIDYAVHDRAWQDLWNEPHFQVLTAHVRCKQQL